MGQVAHVIDFASDPSERRDSARRAIGADSTLRLADGRPIDAVVADLSREGFVVEASMPLALGTAVSIGLPGVGRREAIVVRGTGGCYGCRFGTPLSPADERAAFSDPLVAVAFPGDGAVATFAVASSDHFHPAVRLSILLGGSLMLWTAFIKLAF